MNITIKTLETFNAQEVFDFVATHLLKQNKKAESQQYINSCLYRTQDGLKCAVGCIIADDEYFYEMEGKSVRTVLPNSTENIHFTLLLELQKIHDKPKFTAYWNNDLHELANSLGLSTSSLNPL
jgi:hypothetical protein